MINQERLKEIEDKSLKAGNGKDIDSACVMQMVAYVAGEVLTDHPECACPVLTAYAIELNDTFSDAHRQKLKPFIPMLVGTKADDATQIARKRVIMWRNVTATYPLVLDTVKLSKIAARLREFKNTKADMSAAEKYLADNKQDTNAVANAAANAYANAAANAYAAAAADLREKLADAALETLKLAILEGKAI